MEREIFLNLSPLDHRYYLANKQLFENLSDFLSENAAVRYCWEAEIALIKAHLSIRGEDKEGLFVLLDSYRDQFSPSQIYAEEEKTHHNIRALVNVLVSKLPEKLKPFVHLGATSADILDTASSMRHRDVYKKVLLPLVAGLEQSLISLAEKTRTVSQIGRTHGQHAVPITFGFALSSYISRLGASIVRIEELSSQLKGKLAGAVGGYNALSLLVKDPAALEKKYLEYCGLEACEASTQIVQPEPLLRLLLETNLVFGIIANLADDLRHLQRTEIGEVRESFSKDQVGSSTMPHKRNPWNSEHVKSLWKAFSPRIITFYMDQISEHQRDLTNSASGRFIAEYISGFAAAAARMNKIVDSLDIDAEKMNKNMGLAGDMALAEAAYILLGSAGDAEGHEKIRKITLSCEKNGTSLTEGLKLDKSLWNLIDSALQGLLGVSAELFFSHPSYYRGLSVEKTDQITQKYRKITEELKEKYKWK